MMIEAIHKQLMSELDRAGRADTVFVVSGVLFNTLVLFINWFQAASLGEGKGNLMIYLFFIFGSLLISCTSLLAIVNSRRICDSVHASLQQIYIDHNVAHYLPIELSNLGNKRFILSFIVVGGTGLLALVIPFLQMTGSTNNP